MAQAGGAAWGSEPAQKTGMVSAKAVLPSTSLLYSARATKSPFCGLPPRPEVLAGEGRRWGERCGEPAAGAGEGCCGCCCRGAGCGASIAAVSALLLAAVSPMLRASSTLQFSSEGCTGRMRGGSVRTGRQVKKVFKPSASVHPLTAGRPAAV